MPGAAIATFEVLFIAEMIDAQAAAVWAGLAVFPAHGADVIQAGLFVRERSQQIKEAIKMGKHGSLHQRQNNPTPFLRLGQAGI